MYRKALIKGIELYGKYGSLIKNRGLMKSDVYSEAFRSFDEGFSDRPQTYFLEEAKMRRIVDAYQLAMKHMHSQHFYYVSAEWIPIYKKYHSKVISLLESGDLGSLQSIYSNFFRNDISAGLVGLPTNMRSYYSGAASSIDKRWYVMDSAWRIDQLTQSYPTVGPKDLVAPNIGNPYGYIWQGEFVRVGADYQYACASMLTDHLGLVSDQSILEIGGGYGGMACYLLQKSGSEIKYTDIDLPENLALATYYLMCAFPDTDFLLYGEDESNSGNRSLITMLPSFAIESLSNVTFGVAFNSYSLAEMGGAAAQNYFNYLSAMEVQKVVHINHTRNSATKADDLRLGSRYSLEEKEVSMWNWGRSITADEYLYVYRLNRLDV